MANQPSSVGKRSGAAHVGELERLGPDGREVLVLGLESPGFNDLPDDRKIFAYYLYRAAIAGDTILYMQNHRHALELREMLEAIYLHRKGMDPVVSDAVHDYLKSFWIHHGNYSHATHTKFVPDLLTPQMLLEAVKSAAANGAQFDIKGCGSIEAKLSRLEQTIFDPNYEPLQSNQADGVDMVATSAVNFWDQGVTQADIDALGPEWANRINVRFSKRDGKVTPEVYRIGGLYSRELETISHFLSLATRHAEGEEQRRSLESLLEYFRDGDEELFRQHSVHWLRSDTQVDYLNGFIEHYIDPRGVIGNYEANTSYAADLGLVRDISKNALYFEERMPWPDKFKRTQIDPPVAKVVDALVETGDAGPVSPAAYNLPNYNDLRRDYGSKNVMFRNVENSRSQELHERIVNEFYLPEYREHVLKYQHTVIRPLQVYLHEIVGHGSGQPDPNLEGTPRSTLGKSYSPLEECRADCVALYHLSDPKLVEVGAISANEQPVMVETGYVTYLQNWMLRFDRADGGIVREAHNKGSHAIMSYLVEGGGDPARDFGIDVVEQDGDFFVRLREPGKVREGIAELLDKLQVMKSTGDGAGAAALFARFGSQVREDWRLNMTKRLERVGVPKVKAFVFPHLTPVLRDGHVVDVNMANDESLTDQQLRFSRLRNDTALEAD